MSQRAVPALIATISILFLVLIAGIVMLLRSPEKRLASDRRQNANDILYSQVDGLPGAVASLEAPIKKEGSLDNLLHYLEKDPGRREFARNADQRRAEKYLAGYQEDIDAYGQSVMTADDPLWAPAFIGTVRHLFDSLRDDVMTLSGVPPYLSEFSTGTPPQSQDSVILMVQKALEGFAQRWIPQGELVGSYVLNKKLLREYLLGNRRFMNAMTAQDQAWAQLEAALYNLVRVPNWQRALALDANLGRDWEELIVMVEAADIYRRQADLLALIPGEERFQAYAVEPGIRWVPSFSYYKNIPEVSGQTQDTPPNIFFAKVNLGYTYRDGDTQTWLNRRKEWLTDYFAMFFSKASIRDFSPLSQGERRDAEWRTSILKAEAIHGINMRIIADYPFTKKRDGVKDVAFVRVNIIENP